MKNVVKSVASRSAGLRSETMCRLRRGVSLMELTVAGMLLGVLLTVSLRLMASKATIHQSVANRRAALLEAGNLMERLAAKSWDELTADHELTVELSPAAQKQLGRARVDVEVAPGTDDPASRRISVTIHWNNRAGTAERPVQLVAWRYRDAGKRSTKPQSATDDESQN